MFKNSTRNLVKGIKLLALVVVLVFLLTYLQLILVSVSVFGVALNGPARHRLRVDVSRLSAMVASVTVKPSESIAPFTSSISIHVNPGAPPGVYTFKLKIMDMTTGLLIGSETLALIILRRRVPKTLAKHYQKLKTLYLTYGAQALIWYILVHIFRNGVTFTQIKHVYEIVVGGPVSSGTIGNTLKRMLKRIIVEKTPRIYVANVRDFNVLLSRIDLSRVRLQANVKRRSSQKISETLSEDAKMDFTRLPRPIRRVWGRAQEIASEHNALTALYFLLYSLSI